GIGSWRFDARQSFGPGPRTLGSQFRAAYRQWPVVAVADLRFRSRWLAAHRVQHVVSVEPGQNCGIGLRPLDICHGLPDLWAGGEPRERDLESRHLECRRFWSDLRDCGGSDRIVLSG